MKHYVFARGHVDEKDGLATSRIVRELSPDANFDVLLESGVEPPETNDVVMSFAGEPLWILEPPKVTPYRCVFCFDRKAGMDRADFSSTGGSTTR